MDKRSLEKLCEAAREMREILKSAEPDPATELLDRPIEVTLDRLVEVIEERLRGDFIADYIHELQHLSKTRRTA